MENLDSYAYMREKILFAGDPDESFYRILLALFCSDNSVSSWPQFHDKKVFFTHQGKIAIYSACSLWHIGKGDHVLAPSYNCGSELDPIVATGASVELYQIDSNGNIVEDDLLDRISKKTKLIYVTHYFGWQQDINFLVSQIAGRGIKIIEDCALSLFSQPFQDNIGCQGDAAIFSFPKTLPVPDGGALVLNNEPNCVLEDFLTPSSKDVFLKVLPLLKRRLLRSFDKTALFPFIFSLVNKNKLKKQLLVDAKSGGMPSNYYFDVSKKNWAMSKLTQGLLENVNIERIVCQRRRNYKYLHELLEGLTSIIPLYQELPSNVCPLAFPVITKRRDEFCRKLARCGITAIPWWAGKHRLFDFSEYPDADFLKNNLLVIPIHQELGKRHVEFISQSIISVAKYI